MQTGKIRRTVSKLRQLQDEFNSCPATDLTLWTIKRTQGSPCELPPGLSKAKKLFTVLGQTHDQYVTASEPVDEKLFGPSQTFWALVSRTDDLLKQVDIAPEYRSESILYAVADLSLRNRINRASPYYWQGGTTFAKSWVDRMQVQLPLPLPCLDWFSKVDRLPEAIADTIDELLAGFETSADGQQPPARMEQPATEPPKQTRNKPAVSAEKTQEEIAWQYLLLRHRYGNDNFCSDPIPPLSKFVLWMQEQNAGKPSPSTATVTRMLKDKFGGHAEYLYACRTGSIEQLLTVAAGDAARVFQRQLQRERITTDPDHDLD